MTTVDTEEITFGGARVFTAELFTAAEVDVVRAVVDDVPAGLWHEGRRTPDGGSMGTIGEPLYRNRERLEHYAACARAENRVLYRHFRVVHERVAAFFEQRYGLPVVYAEELAVPGFHVFGFEGPGEYLGGCWHVDVLETQAPCLVARDADITAVVNFTVPFELPDGGSGMDLEADGPAATAARRGGGQAITVPYRAGRMLFTESEVWHRISGSRCLSPGQRRVTHQGHGVRLDDRWILFW
ncbi:hypothetical protein M8542_19755 [Amycolatopsis sp. OK19-0408]|uniref:Uncharacterized protein n=1 Tax=Amycolatopsis iheyensis TaxID=2945988 RepID=A0A9X2NC33_9PSEU|nr:hypothetical protein [Amycolatopsis iheyensis]MCR6485067.1 hypothetical protein [Amycolatopsis iheyensis]